MNHLFDLFNLYFTFSINFFFISYKFPPFSAFIFKRKMPILCGLIIQLFPDFSAPCCLFYLLILSFEIVLSKDMNVFIFIKQQWLNPHLWHLKVLKILLFPELSFSLVSVTLQTLSAFNFPPEIVLGFLHQLFFTFHLLQAFLGLPSNLFSSDFTPFWDLNNILQFNDHKLYFQQLLYLLRKVLNYFSVSQHRKHEIWILLF